MQPESAVVFIGKSGVRTFCVEHFEKAKELTGKEKLLIDQREAALFSKELAILDKAVPLDCKLSKLKVVDPDGERLFNIFQDLEFRQLAEEF